MHLRSDREIRRKYDNIGTLFATLGMAMKKMGLVDEKWELTPRDTHVRTWEDDVPIANEIANMEVYAAMVELMDAGIGRVVDSLKDKGIFDNTLILFLQDNGMPRNWIGLIRRPTRTTRP